MGKNNKKKNQNRYREDFDDKSSYMPRSYNDTKAPTGGYKKFPRPKREKFEPHPVATTVCDELVRQIHFFEDELDTGMNLMDAASKLFTLPAYPCELDAHPGYSVFQLDRSVRQSKKDPNLLYLPSTIILVMDTEKQIPAFLARAMMYSKDDGSYKSTITVMELDENGPVKGHILQHFINDDR